jgi:flagellar hook-associated protein 1 FlgK
LSGISSILDIAKTALSASQAELDTTSHNIANANTDGYTRQRVMAQAIQPIQTTYGYLGSGVDVKAVERVRDAFVDEQTRNLNSDLSKSTIYQQAMTQVESIFNETAGNGLSTQLTALFNAFQTLSQTPEDMGVRQTVMQTGVQVATSFNMLNSKLKNLQYQVGLQVSDEVRKINEQAATIAKLNSQILANATAFKDAPDLKDQMDSAIDQLSKMINVKVTVDANGITNISAGGTVLVAAGTAYALSVSHTSNGITVTPYDSNESLTLTSGELYGLLDVYNSKISQYSSRLDEIANALVQTLNSFHSTGYTLSIGGAPSETGKTFFQGNTAGSIQISPDILASLNNIAASSNGDPGSGDNASAIANVLNAPVMSDGTSIIKAYEGLIGQVGLDSQNANSNMNMLQVAYNQMNTFRQSISGVSIDEELANMIQYQHSFEAAAKVVSTVDQMYQSIINMV